MHAPRTTIRVLRFWEESENFLWGNVWVPASVEDLLGAPIMPTGNPLANAVFMDEPPKYIWRGQANLQWPLHSSLVRRILRSHEYPPGQLEETVIGFETQLRNQAARRGLTRGLWPSTRREELLGSSVGSAPGKS